MSDHDEQDEAPETYDESVKRIKDGALNTTLGWANFLHQTALYEEQKLRDLLQSVANGNRHQELTDWLNEKADDYAESRADDEQFDRPVYKPSFAPIDMLKMAGDICAPFVQQPKDYEVGK